MKTLVSNFKKAVSTFHNNEEGMETLQVVLITALAAVAGVAVFNFGSQAVSWTQEQMRGLFPNTDYGVSKTH